MEGLGFGVEERRIARHQEVQLENSVVTRQHNADVEQSLGEAYTRERDQVHGQLAEVSAAGRELDEHHVIRYLAHTRLIVLGNADWC